MLGDELFVLRVSDTELIQAYNHRTKLDATDGLNESKTVFIRDQLHIPNADLLSLFWLKNRLVNIRKSRPQIVRAGLEPLASTEDRKRGMGR